MSLDAIEQLQRELEEQKQALLARKAKRKPGRKPGDLSDDRLRALVEAHLAIEAEEAAED